MTVDTITRKRLPAFGRELRALRDAGRVPRGGMVVITLSFRTPHHWYFRLVVGDDTDPHEIDFSDLAGVNCVVVVTPADDPARVSAVIEQIKRCRPRSLQTWHHESSDIEFVVCAHDAQENEP
jgi:hypothetical protein